MPISVMFWIDWHIMYIPQYYSHQIKTVMRHIIIYIAVFFLTLGSTTLNAQCPASIASLGNGNGLQICWPRNEAPATLTQIVYDGVTYTGVTLLMEEVVIVGEQTKLLLQELTVITK